MYLEDLELGGLVEAAIEELKDVGLDLGHRQCASQANSGFCTLWCWYLEEKTRSSSTRRDYSDSSLQTTRSIMNPPSIYFQARTSQ